MGLFATAAAKKQSAPKSKKSKRSTTWLVGGSESDQKVAEAVTKFCEIKAEMRALDAKKEVHKAIIKPHADKKYVEAYADLGVPPESPMCVQNGEGQKVTFVVQDR